MSGARVEVRGVSLRLGEFAVRDVSLDVAAGEYFVLLGPTGAGKTVLLECIAGLHRPAQGDIFIAGRQVTDVPPERRGIGYLPQDYALFPHLNVRDNIAFGMKLRRWPAHDISRRVAELAEMLHITHLLHRSPLRLSGGERQRVALARALAISPRVLLLDEPLSALDEQTREGLCLELRRLQRELGTTTIHVSHNFEETLMVADRIGILHQGQVQQVGTPEEVFRHPASEFVARFVRCDNLLPGRAEWRNGALVVSVHNLELRAVDGPTGPVLLTVRPEEVVASREPPGDPALNIIPGRVARVIDRGPLVRVDIEGAVSLVALIGRPAFRQLNLQPGEPAYASFPPSAAYLLPASGTD